MASAPSLPTRRVDCLRSQVGDGDYREAFRGSQGKSTTCWAPPPISTIILLFSELRECVRFERTPAPSVSEATQIADYLFPSDTYACFSEITIIVIRSTNDRFYRKQRRAEAVPTAGFELRDGGRERHFEYSGLTAAPHSFFFESPKSGAAAGFGRVALVVPVRLELEVARGLECGYPCQ